MAHWHILGAGAIGGLWACHLQQAGHNPTLILKDRHRLADYPGHLTLTGDQRATQYPVNAQTPADDEPIQRLLVTTKSYATEAALRAVAHRLAPRAVIVLLHNGMGPQQQACEDYPGALIYAGTTTEGAWRPGYWEIVHAGRGQTWFGPLNPTARQAGREPLETLLALPFETGYDPGILDRLWQKLAINAAINGLTALHQCANGTLATEPAYHAEMAALCRETEILAQYLKQPLFDRPLIEAATRVAEATASNYSSMLQDIRGQRRTEIDFINGYLCRQAKTHNIDLPHHERLVAAVASLEAEKSD